jgi:hypothetical protein
MYLIYLFSNASRWVLLEFVCGLLVFVSGCIPLSYSEPSETQSSTKLRKLNITQRDMLTLTHSSQSLQVRIHTMFCLSDCLGPVAQRLSVRTLPLDKAYDTHSSADDADSFCGWIVLAHCLCHEPSARLENSTKAKLAGLQTSCQIQQSISKPV